MMLKQRPGQYHASDSLHHRFLVVRNRSAAVPVHDAEAIVERDQISDRAFSYNTGIIGAALANPIAFGNLFGSRLRRGGLERTVKSRSDILWGLAVASQDRLDFEPGNSNTSPPRPVTVRTCFGSIF